MILLFVSLWCAPLTHTEQHGEVNPTRSVSRLEIESVGLVKQRRVEDDRTIALVRHSHSVLVRITELLRQFFDFGVSRMRIHVLEAHALLCSLLVYYKTPMCCCCCLLCVSGEPQIHVHRCVVGMNAYSFTGAIVLIPPGISES